MTLGELAVAISLTAFFFLHLMLIFRPGTGDPTPDGAGPIP